MDEQKPDVLEILRQQGYGLPPPPSDDEAKKQKEQRNICVLRAFAKELGLANQLVQRRAATQEEWDRVKYDPHKQFVLNLAPPKELMNPDPKTTWDGKLPELDYSLLKVFAEGFK